MIDSSSSARVTQYLRRLAAAEPPGARLPSVRDIMRALHVSPTTIQRALDLLVREGTLETRPGRGTFVAEGPPPQHPPTDLDWQMLALGTGRASPGALGTLCLVPPDQARALNAGYLPAELQPTALLTAAATRAIRRPGIWTRMPVEGLPALRAWFAAATAGAYQPHEVTICPGTQAAIAAAFRALAAAGDPVLIESPTYVGAMAAAQAAGLRLVPVPTDVDGLRPDLLADAFRRTGARLLYCQPTYANPTGWVLAPARRQAVMAAVKDANAFLIEDDWARDFHLDGDAPPRPLASTDPDGHVVYVRSLTKSAAPGLRIGAICAHGAALGRLRAARLVDDFFVPGVLQEAALQTVTTPHWARHLRSLQTALRKRRDAMAAALHLHFGASALPHLPAGGLHLWLRLPDDASDLKLEQLAANEGLLVSAGRHWYPAEPPAPYLRLSFAAAHPEWIHPCIGRLAELCRVG